MKMKNYPFYEVEEVCSLKELLNMVAQKYGTRTAFQFERNKEIINISFEQFRADVNALGTVFVHMGLQESKIAVIGENSYEWILTYFAAVNSGSVIVPLDKDLPAADIKKLVHHSDTYTLVYSDVYADIAEHLQENGAEIMHYVNMDKLNDMLGLGYARMKHGDVSALDYEVIPNALAVILYTSGTTGNIKGAMLSHLNLACNAVATCKMVLFEKNSLLFLPMHHILAIYAGVFVMLLQGTTIAINSSLKSLPKDLQQYSPLNALMVPLFAETFYHKMAKGGNGKDKPNSLSPWKDSVLGPSMSVICCGGAPVDPEYVSAYREIGVSFLEVYGLTECAGTVSINRNEYYREGSVGLILPACEVKIAAPDEHGNGEICVKGNTVMLGYYQNKEATEEVFDGAWFKTGDIGHLNEDGFLFICGRKKNMILLHNGKNVYPEEIEIAVQKEIPYIKEIIVYGDGNVIAAEVLLDTENKPDCIKCLDHDISCFNQTQAVYKNIGKLVIRETSFPRTASKKIKR